MSNLIFLKTQAQFSQIIKENDTVICHFTAHDCALSTKMDDTFKRYANSSTNIVFLKIDLYKFVELFRALSVDTIPTFVFIKKGYEHENSRIVGSNEYKLEQNMYKYCQINKSATINIKNRNDNDIISGDCKDNGSNINEGRTMNICMDNNDSKDDINNSIDSLYDFNEIEKKLAWIDPNIKIRYDSDCDSLYEFNDGKYNLIKKYSKPNVYVLCPLNYHLFEYMVNNGFNINILSKFIENPNEFTIGKIFKENKLNYNITPIKEINRGNIIIPKDFVYKFDLNKSILNLIKYNNIVTYYDVNNKIWLHGTIIDPHKIQTYNIPIKTHNNLIIYVPIHYIKNILNLYQK